MRRKWLELRRHANVFSSLFLLKCQVANALTNKIGDVQSRQERAKALFLGSVTDDFRFCSGRLTLRT